MYEHAEENAAEFRRWVKDRQEEVESGEVAYEASDNDDELEWQP